jgi:3-oxoacyl-[acyl-carrier protein] reductase
VPSEKPVAVVTGAAQGIGAATARRLAADGMNVALLDLQDEKVKAIAEDLRGAGHEALAFRCDVTSEHDVEAAFKEIGETWERVDVLVSNAGVTRDNLIFRMGPDDWDLVIATHLRGGYLTARAAQRFMVKQRSGALIFISSRAALGNRGQSNYSAAKAGLQGLARTLAIELGPFGITSNAIAPGFIDTDMTRAIIEKTSQSWEDLTKDVLGKNSVKRLGIPDDIAGTVSFLASKDATYLTGQVLYVMGR